MLLYLLGLAAACAGAYRCAIDQALATWEQTCKRSLDSKSDPEGMLCALAVELVSADQRERLCTARSAALLPQLTQPADREGSDPISKLGDFGLVGRSREA